MTGSREQDAFGPEAKFTLGQLVATPGALETISCYGINPLELLGRHVTGDWGDLSPADKRENDFSVHRRLRILSAYGTGDSKLWVITEADRSVTTILRPDEY
jgi:hypothetical protein